MLDGPFLSRTGPLPVGRDAIEEAMQYAEEFITQDEPVGIVISRGSRDEAVPRVIAYIWSDGEEYAQPEVAPRCAA